MKKLFALLAAAAILAVLFASCSKDDDNDNTGGDGTPTATLLDRNGNPIVTGDDGHYYDLQGNIVYLDDDGLPVVVDDYGNPIITDDSGRLVTTAAPDDSDPSDNSNALIGEWDWVATRTKWFTFNANGTGTRGTGETPIRWATNRGVLLICTCDPSECRRVLTCGSAERWDFLLNMNSLTLTRGSVTRDYVRRAE
jgi:hypothetical protein